MSFPPRYRMAASNKARCKAGTDIRNEHDQASVQFHLTEELNKVEAVVRDECQLIFDYALSEPNPAYR